MFLRLNDFCQLFLQAENWQPNMVLDDGGDATHLLVKKSRVFLRSSVGSVFQQLGGVCVVVVVGVGALRLAILPCGLLGAPRSW